MDSSVVNRWIRKRIWPVLREVDFTRFTPRTAWRYTSTRIEVVNFQSFNSYLAESVGATTYSFSVNLASYLLEIPSSHGPDYPKTKDDQLIPQEYDCHLRTRLQRSFPQAELDRRDIWFIDAGGESLEPAFADVAAQFSAAALPWFETMRDGNTVLRILSTGQETDALFGFGRNPSPQRAYVAGYFAMSRKDWPAAIERLTAALESGSYSNLTDALTRDIDLCHRAMR